MGDTSDRELTRGTLEFSRFLVKAVECDRYACLGVAVKGDDNTVRITGHNVEPQVLINMWAVLGKLLCERLVHTTGDPHDQLLGAMIRRTVEEVGKLEG